METIKLVCAVCNTPLSFTTQVEQGGKLIISITPCAHCAKQEYDCGYYDGKED